MKKFYSMIVIIVAVAISLSYTANAQVAVNDDGSIPDISTMLDVKSTDKGILIPRMSATEMGNITTPPTGLLVFNNTANDFFYYNGSNWVTIGDAAGAGKFVDGTDPLEAVYTNGNVGIGTTDPQDKLHIKLSGTSIHDALRFETSQTTNEDWYIYMPTTDNLVFRNDVLDAVTIQKNTGNLGIGTTNPETKLEVSGQVKITGGTPGTDKVLTSDANGLATWEPVTEGSGDNNPGEAGIGNNYGTVVNNVTGKVWLDRNLGASQVATSSTDANAYGDLYQWGRAADGHQLRTSSTDAGPVNKWIADEGDSWYEKFITNVTGYPSDWLITPKDDLWTGTSAENNPCPSGFRIPTNAEWIQERRTWSSDNSAGAFASMLKLTTGGSRNYEGTFTDVGETGMYWSSTVDVNVSRHLVIISTAAYMGTRVRSNGFSIRCIKD